MANTVEVKLTLKGRLVESYKRISKQIQGQNKRIRSSFKRVGKDSKKAFNDMRSASLGAKAALIGISAFFAGRFASSILKAGSEVEDLTTQFKVLLGSVGAARKRMEELEKFAQTTPFQLKEVAQASRVLETLTKGALSTGDSLRMVGDAAAVAGVSFSELAVWVGRAFSGLQANRPIGEALARFQELGLITGDVRNKVEKLQQQAKGKQAWNVLNAALKENKGGMEELSKTVTGLSSTIKDQLAAVIRQMLATGIWDKLRELLKGVVERLTKALESGVFTKWGEKIMQLAENFGDLIKVGRSIFAVFVVGKIKALAVAFGALVFQLVALNPIIASLVALQTSFDLLLLKMGKDAELAAKGITDYAKSVEKASQLKKALENIKLMTSEVKAQEKAVDAATKAYGDLSNAQFKEQRILGELKAKLKPVVQEFENLTRTGILRGGELSDINQLIKVVDSKIKLLNVAKKAVEDDETKPPPPPPGGTPAALADPDFLQQARAFQEEQKIRDARVEAMNAEMAEKHRLAQEEFEMRVQQRERIEELSRQQRDEEIRNAKAVADAQRAAALSATSSVLGSFMTMTQGSEKYYEQYKTFAAGQAVIDAIASANASYKALAGIPIVGPGLGAAAGAAALIAGMARANQIKGMTFAKGGIANKASIFGEAGPEAAVPLPDGRSIPVKLSGATGNFSPTIIVNGASDPSATAGMVGQTVEEQYKEFQETDRERRALGAV